MNSDQLASAEASNQDPHYFFYPLEGSISIMKFHNLGIFLGLIWGGISALSQLRNKQKLPKMVYIIPNLLVLHLVKIL